MNGLCSNFSNAQQIVVTYGTNAVLDVFSSVKSVFSSLFNETILIEETLRRVQYRLDVIKCKTTEFIANNQSAIAVTVTGIGIFILGTAAYCIKNTRQSPKRALKIASIKKTRIAGNERVKTISESRIAQIVAKQAQRRATGKFKQAVNEKRSLEIQAIIKKLQEDIQETGLKLEERIARRELDRVRAAAATGK